MEKPEIRDEWNFEDGTGETRQRVYFRRYAVNLAIHIRPDRELGISVVTVTLDDSMVHRSEHEGIAFAKQIGVSAASRAIIAREAVCANDPYEESA